MIDLEVQAEAYGIPREGPFYTTEKSRAFCKHSFCHERKQYQEELDYANIELFYEKLQGTDTFCASEAFRVNMFGENSAKNTSISRLFVLAKEAATTMMMMKIACKTQRGL